MRDDETKVSEFMHSTHRDGIHTHYGDMVRKVAASIGMEQRQLGMYTPEEAERLARRVDEEADKAESEGA